MLSRIGIRIDSSELYDADVAIQGLGNAIEKISRKRRSIELPKFRKNATRKLHNVMLALATNIAYNFSINTPVGDTERIYQGLEPNANNTDRNYARLYANRLADYGISMQSGYHAGAYVYSEKSVPDFNPRINSIEEMLAQVKADFNNNYVLGDVFYIAAKGPAYKFMSQGDIGDGEGVLQPTISSIMSTYAMDLQAAYSKRAR